MIQTFESQTSTRTAEIETFENRPGRAVVRAWEAGSLSFVSSMPTKWAEENAQDWVDGSAS